MKKQLKQAFNAGMNRCLGDFHDFKQTHPTFEEWYAQQDTTEMEDHALDAQRIADLLEDMVSERAQQDYKLVYEDAAEHARNMRLIWQEGGADE